jgi:hypothetical protein
VCLKLDVVVADLVEGAQAVACQRRRAARQSA